MELLAKHIHERLSTKPFCTVFENQLARVFPRSPTADQKRRTAIQDFARSHGWSAKISDPGWRVTFRKLREEKPGELHQQVA